METPEIAFSEFRKLKVDQIREMKSARVTANGETLFTAIICPKDAGMIITDTINIQADYLGARANIAGGKDPAEILGKEPVSA